MIRARLTPFMRFIPFMVGATASALLALLAIVIEPQLSFAEPKNPHAPSLTDGMECTGCHSTEGWSLAAGRGGGFDHARTGFPLTGRHAQTACVGCHAPEHRLSRECVGCHEDPHERRMGEQCDTCHDARAWQLTSARKRHEQTRLPLTGMHAVAECTECHQRSASRQWSTPPADCFACHAKDYRRKDIHPLHIGGTNPTRAPFPRDCGECHRAIGWSPAFVDPLQVQRLVGASSAALSRAPEDHELLFPIAHGPHRAAACEDCHSNAETFPRAVRCEGCHAHTPQKIQASHARVAGAVREGSCLHCHRGGAAP